MRQMVDDLEALRAALGRDRLVLFGHSYGSLLAMAYYRAHPSHVARLVLAGSLPPVMDETMSEAHDKALERRETAMMSREDDIARALAEAGLPSDARRDTPRQARMRLRIRYNAPLDLVHVERWHQLTSGGIYYNHAAGAAIAASMPVWDVRPAIAAHPVPITVIQGDSDYLDPSARLWSALARREKSTCTSSAMPGIAPGSTNRRHSPRHCAMVWTAIDAYDWPGVVDFISWRNCRDPRRQPQRARPKGKDDVDPIRSTSVPVDRCYRFRTPVSRRFSVAA